MVRNMKKHTHSCGMSTENLNSDRDFVAVRYHMILLQPKPPQAIQCKFSKRIRTCTKVKQTKIHTSRWQVTERPLVRFTPKSLLQCALRVCSHFIQTTNCLPLPLILQPHLMPKIDPAMQKGNCKAQEFRFPISHQKQNDCLEICTSDWRSKQSCAPSSEPARKFAFVNKRTCVIVILFWPLTIETL